MAKEETPQSGIGRYGDASLTKEEAKHLIRVLKAQPVPVSRDFYLEDMEDAILKKLQAIANG